MTSRAQHDVGVHPLAPQIEKAVRRAACPPGYSASLLTGNGSGSAADSNSKASMTSSTSPVARFGLTVSAERSTIRPVNDTTLSSRSPSTCGEQRRRDVDHALRDAVMVAQIDEQQLAVVALAVHPARQPGRGAGIRQAERAAGMGAIGVHQTGSGAGLGRRGTRHGSPALVKKCGRAATRGNDAAPPMPRRAAPHMPRIDPVTERGSRRGQRPLST